MPHRALTVASWCFSRFAFLLDLQLWLFSSPVSLPGSRPLRNERFAMAQVGGRQRCLRDSGSYADDQVDESVAIRGGEATSAGAR